MGARFCMRAELLVALVSLKCNIAARLLTNVGITHTLKLKIKKIEKRTRSRTLIHKELAGHVFIYTTKYKMHVLSLCLVECV